MAVTETSSLKVEAVVMAVAMVNQHDEVVLVEENHENSEDSKK